MKVIGITGGVGAGKSTVLSILKEISNSKIILADDVAKNLMINDSNVIKAAKQLFGNDVYDEKGIMNKAIVAKAIFESDAIRRQWELIIHPATNAAIYAAIDEEREAGQIDFLFIEAALLIENHYDEVCDEIWYVRANQRIRIARLMSSRGYSRKKCLDIITSQKSDREFLQNTDYIINSTKTLEELKRILKNKLEEYR